MVVLPVGRCVTCWQCWWQGAFSAVTKPYTLHGQSILGKTETRQKESRPPVIVTRKHFAHPCRERIELDRFLVACLLLWPDGDIASTDEGRCVCEGGCKQAVCGAGLRVRSSDTAPNQKCPTPQLSFLHPTEFLPETLLWSFALKERDSESRE